jgi:2-(1,2-epoxy-1,2-dihydrophenyl)acetyl-CoA isomerase
MTTEAPLVAETRGAVRWLRLNRPDKLNALTNAMAELLRGELESSATDDGIGAIVITGTGRAFCAGVDVKEALDGPDATILQKRALPLWPIEELVNSPKPTIVALNGPAYGGGATISVAADLRVAADSASFTFNLAKVGLTPECGSSYLLWRHVGYGTALDLMLTGRKVDAQEALALRLVQRVVPAADLAEEAQTLGEALAALPAGTAAAVKGVLRAGLDGDFPEARRTELRALRDRGRARAEARAKERPA